MEIHELKIAPQNFIEIVVGLKEFEIRFNDRNYQVGDLLILNEWNGKEYTGKSIKVFVTYILNDFVGLQTGYIAMGIKQLR